MEYSRYTIQFPRLNKIKEFRFPYGDTIVPVTSKSPLVLRKSLSLCAQYFQREGYSDFTHYSLNEKDYVGYLFVDRGWYHATGGCLFRLRKYSNIPEEYWSMHWAWLHPFVRNKGLLSKNIEVFNNKFGYWFPEYPHSKAMQHFVKKHSLVDPFTKFNVQ